MLSLYKHLKPRHPAYKAMGEVRDGVRDLQIAIERTKLKYDAHRGGYLSRFRTFDATADNVVIEKKAKDLMERLDLFTKLMNLPERAKTPPPSPAATDSEDECVFNGLLDPLRHPCF